MAYLQGGLGNQCFIYATARALALKTSAELVLDGGYFLADKIYRRTYALDVFKLQSSVLKLPSPTAKLQIHLRRIRYALLRNRVSRLGNYCCDRRPFKFRPLPDKWRGILTLDGYWQSEKYFYDARSTLLEDFSLSDGKWLEKDAVARKINLTATSVFLHVRSYKEVPGCEDGRLAIQMADYYRNALEKLGHMLGGGSVFVFSDDIEWAKARFVANWARTFPEFEFVAIDGESSQLRDFSLMRLCRHGILSDSSFSWWAAWLGEQQHAVPGMDSIHIYPASECLNFDFWPERWKGVTQ